MSRFTKSTANFIRPGPGIGALQRPGGPVLFAQNRPLAPFTTSYALKVSDATVVITGTTHVRAKVRNGYVGGQLADWDMDGGAHFETGDLAAGLHCIYAELLVERVTGQGYWQIVAPAPGASSSSIHEAGSFPASTYSAPAKAILRIAEVTVAAAVGPVPAYISGIEQFAIGSQSWLRSGGPASIDDTFFGIVSML